MTRSKPYDICIIGAGSAGLSVAAGAAQLGLSTVLIEKSDMGGDCLNTGCVPSKALIAAANAAHVFTNSQPFGIAAHTPDIDFAAVKAHVQNTIDAIAPHDSQERFEGLGVTVIREAARFIGPHTVQAGSHTIRAKHFVIATGSRPAVPSIEGLDPSKALTNETIFNLTERPDHLIIIGGGPIGIEMAQAHSRLGCKVTVLDKAMILPHDDPKLVNRLRDILTDEGINIEEHVTIQKITHGKKHVTVSLSHETIKGSHIMIAAGRTPNIDAMGLDAAGVNTNAHGVIVDEGLQTSQPHIFAAGDVTGGPQFTHVAGYHAGILIRRIAFKMWFAKTDYTALPWVTYTDPGLANVGLTEIQAIEKHGHEAVKTLQKPLSENDRARAENRTEGMIKITALTNGTILGAAILAPHAGDLIGIWALAITKKMKLKDITGMIAPYPTFGEISKHIAGQWYTPSLFSARTRWIVSLLQKLPF